MANYDNIKPYADFAHKAAKAGGVDKYLDEFGNAKYDLGVASEKETEGWKALLVIGITLGLWEAGKAGIRKIKDNNRTKKMKAIIRVDKARKECLSSVSKCATNAEIEPEVTSNDEPDIETK